MVRGQVAASWREAAGLGETDAFTASEVPAGRRYDRVIALTRSGTTTEVLDLLATCAVRCRPPSSWAIWAPRLRSWPTGSSTCRFADEQSVVQTRFATSALLLFRAAWRGDVEGLADAAAEAVDGPARPGLAAAEQSTFLGRGWTVGLAHEAALKFRETSSSWAESYPAMDYRHGPISIAAPAGRSGCSASRPAGLAEEVAATGATWIADDRDPMVQLVTVQRVAVARALALGLDPDTPRNLTRSVVLTG